MKYLLWIIAALVVGGPVVIASLPPTQTKGQGDSAYSTTFQFNFPSFPISKSGTVATFGTLAVGGGGTGQTTYSDGQLLIGNSATGSLSKATLTQGSGVTITNGNGSITISASGSGAKVYSAHLAAPSGGACAISREYVNNSSSSWVNGTPSSAGTGRCTLTFDTGILDTLDPNCVCSVGENTAVRICSIRAIVSGVSVETLTGDNAAAADNMPLNIYCIGGD